MACFLVFMYFGLLLNKLHCEIDLHALVLQKHISFLDTVFHHCLKRSVLAPVSLRPHPLPNTQSPPIGQLTHAC